jgi:putative flippase GtrA
VTRQYISFLAVGVVAGLLNVLARFLFDLVMSYDVAIVLAFVVGLTVAYFLNRRHVFPQSGAPTARQYGRFAAVNVAMLGQVWAVSVLLAEHLFPAAGLTWRAHDIAHVIGVGSPAVTSYFAHKYFSFT